MRLRFCSGARIYERDRHCKLNPKTVSPMLQTPRTSTSRIGQHYVALTENELILEHLKESQESIRHKFLQGQVSTFTNNHFQKPRFRSLAKLIQPPAPQESAQPSHPSPPDLFPPGHWTSTSGTSVSDPKPK